MKFLQKQLEKMDPLFEKGGKLEKLHPLWDAQSTFLFTPKEVTEKGPHVRDSIDLKRVMITVVMALIPVVLFSFYNTGYQMARAYGVEASLPWWQMFINGAITNLPIILVSYAVGGLWEGLFAVIRRHKISEGFLVTGMLFPLTLPATIPLWQVAVGVSFGVVIGKEVFGGTGMNILNPALTGRAFLFFSFPKDISGSDVWIKHYNPSAFPYLDNFLLWDPSWKLVDGYSGATALLQAASTGAAQKPVDVLTSGGYAHFDWWNLFVGLVPGSMGETSALVALIGAAILILTGVGSWQIITSCILGAAAMAGFMGIFTDVGLPAVPWHYHLVMGGFMFGAVYMATDPVSAAHSGMGKWIYGFLIGVLCILIRVWNPAYPEGMMLSILFMNIFAPLIDHYVVKANINRRLKRATG